MISLQINLYFYKILQLFIDSNLFPYYIIH